LLLLRQDDVRANDMNTVLYFLNSTSLAWNIGLWPESDEEANLRLVLNIEQMSNTIGNTCHKGEDIFLRKTVHH
jgi:hypothetical protein